MVEIKPCFEKIKQRYIGRSHEDILRQSRAFSEGHKFRNERTISGTLFDKATDLDFNNADDFKIFENLYNFNENTYGPWRSPKSVPGHIQYLNSKKDFFNQYIEYYKDKNKLSETGAIKKLQQIEQKAKEMNLSGYDFGDLIEERKNELKTWMLGDIFITIMLFVSSFALFQKYSEQVKEPDIRLLIFGIIFIIVGIFCIFFFYSFVKKQSSVLFF